MVSWFKKLGLVAAVAASALLSACLGDSSSNQATDVVAVAKADPQFSVLVEAIDAAGLTSTLSGPGPYTVFAPTNAAFTSLLAELGISKDALFANKTLLTAVLKYHVLGAKVLKADIPLGKQITPLAGGIFKIDAVGSTLTITDGRNRSSHITATDVAASNGVIHVVDTVLLPADKTVVETAIALAGGNPAEFTVLVDAVVAAGLVDTLNGAGPFTVFAPTDAAFANLLADLGLTKDELLANTALLTKVLTYHVVSGEVLKAEVPLNTPITTLEGETFSIDANLAITDQSGATAHITATDVLASNGVIHVIDKVLLPTL